MFSSVTRVKTSRSSVPRIAGPQNQGIKVWFDVGISPGSEWSEQLAWKISGAAHLVTGNLRGIPTGVYHFGHHDFALYRFLTGPRI